MSDHGSPNGSGKSATRRTMIGTSAAGIAAMLAGCSGDDGGSAEGTSEAGGTSESGGDATATMNDNALEVLHGWTGDDGKRAIDKITAMFGEQYPDVKTNFRPIGGGGNVNLDSVVARRLANRNAPDAFAGWPGKNLFKYGGRLGNMTDVWEENGFVDSMNPKAAELSKYNGEYRAVPLGSHRLNNLFYNKQVLDDAGVDPSSLTSHDALISAYEKIQKNTDAVPMAHSAKGPWTQLQLWAEIMLGEQGMDAYMNFINGEGDKAKVKSALQSMQEILENHITDDAATIGFTEANQKVIDGEAATIHQGNWAYSMYRKNDSFNFEEDWGWNAYPGTESMYVLHIDGFNFTRDNKAPIKQEKWAKFVGQKDAQIEFGKRKGTVPLRTDIDSSKLPDFLQLNADHLKNKSDQPPTIAHGLAVEPEKVGSCKAAFANNFMGPYNADAAAQALIDAVA